MLLSVCVCVCVSYVAIYVLQRLSGIGHRQVGVHDEPQSTWSLVVVKTILAGLKGQKALLPEERQAAKDHRQAGRKTGRKMYE